MKGKCRRPQANVEVDNHVLKGVDELSDDVEAWLIDVLVDFDNFCSDGQHDLPASIIILLLVLKRSHSCYPHPLRLPGRHLHGATTNTKPFTSLRQRLPFNTHMRSL